MDHNAWVTVLQGQKRWMLFPPATPAHAVGMSDPQIPSSIWFHLHDKKVTSDDYGPRSGDQSKYCKILEKLSACELHLSAQVTTESGNGNK
eukprot:scaffold100592_cov49-Attheya_sp.AAC.2